jgi:NACHT domain/Tetratricopeptide repeat
MSERRILVIGSQCEALQHLDFLPRAARDLYAVMTDPERGACVSALDGEGLLIDPAVTDTKDAIRTAYQRAAKDEATLFIVYIGHGEHVGERYYLLPRDAQVPPTADTAVHLTNLIGETHDTTAGQVDGLAVLVDACYAGLAGFSAAQAWVRDLQGTLRFEMLTAAADRPAADGCFSRTLARLLRDGISAVPTEHLRCFDLRLRLEKSCPNQVPQHPAYNPDEALWLAKNAGRIREPWAHGPLADQIQKLTLAYQVTPDLAEVVARSQAERCVAVVGAAGSGKSALAAALAWPEVAGGSVPAGFVQAVAFLTEATTAQELARILAEQLVRSVPRFQDAQQAFTKETPYAEQQRLGSWERQVVGPLSRLAPAAEVRLVIDGLDRLATGARAAMDALNDLVALPFVRLIVTARPDTELPEAASIPYVLALAPAEKVARYLQERSVAQARQDEVIKAAEGNWLVVRVLGDLMSGHPDVEIQAGTLALGDAYEEMLSRCGANEATWRVLSIMAAGGAGPVLPLTLLCAASQKLGGVATQAGLRDELFRLRGLVTRTAAGTDREHAGLFHQTLVEHVAGRGPQDLLAAHRALADCIEVLAPAGAEPIDLNDPIQRYAFEREAEHLWALGETDRAVQSLSARTTAAPRDNLRRWRLWGPRVESRFAADHPSTLTTRANIAWWTGQCGDAGEALRLFQALLPDRVRVLGADHPDTLTTRNSIAGWTGDCGDNREALRLFQALLSDQLHSVGADHPSTLRTRVNIAVFTGRCGDNREALRLSQALLPDLTRVLGADHRGTLTTRNSIAFWTGDCGDGPESLRLFRALLPDKTRVLGADDPDTLDTRVQIALWTARCGDALEALRLFRALLPDQTRVLGADHPDTLRTRNNIATLSD